MRSDMASGLGTRRWAFLNPVLNTSVTGQATNSKGEWGAISVVTYLLGLTYICVTIPFLINVLSTIL